MYLEPDIFAAREAYRKGDILTAYKTFKPYLSKTAQGPDDPLVIRQSMALCGLADCYAKQGSYAESERLLEHAIHMIGLTPEGWRVELSYSQYLADRGRWTDAERRLQSALNGCLKNKTMVSEAELCQFKLGELYERQGKHAEAAKFYQDAFVLGPTNNVLSFKAWSNAALAKAEAGDKVQAETAYTKLMEDLDKASSEARYTVEPQVIGNRIEVLKELTAEDHTERKQAIAVLETLKATLEESAKSFVLTPMKAGNNVDFGPYMTKLQKQIKSKWRPPHDAETKRVVVVFKVHQDGSQTDLKIHQSSGVAKADEAALKAINAASPFAVLPDGAPEAVDIMFTFDYNVYKGYGFGYSPAPRKTDRSEKTNKGEKSGPKN